MMLKSNAEELALIAEEIGAAVIRGLVHYSRGKETTRHRDRDSVSLKGEGTCESG
jgi:hypothetical protein